MNTLSASDVYDFYGLSLMTGMDDDELIDQRSLHLQEIRQKYIDSLKERIKAEAGYINLDVDGDSLVQLCGRISNALEKEIDQQAEKMRLFGQGFNMMDMIQQAHEAKPKGLEAAPEAFRSKQGTSRAMFGGEPWAQISEAFLAIEKAETDSEIILAIDQLNSLQHNTNYVLFDITGYANVHDVLNEKFAAAHPAEFKSKMSKDVIELLVKAGIFND